MNTAEMPAGWDGLGFGATSPTVQSIQERLRQQGFGLLSAEQVYSMIGENAAASCAAAMPLWSHLPADRYLKDGGRYRSRRHGSFVQQLDAQGSESEMIHVPHRAHWQPITYNALHGGMLRWFEPLTDELVGLAFWQPLLCQLGRLFAEVRPVEQWFIEAHQFRIDARDGVGRPTPEGAHRDGVDFVAVILMGRNNIRGGETRVFELDGLRGVRFTLTQPCSVLLMDDQRINHESTPIMPLDAQSDSWRDTLVLTFRADGFLEPVHPVTSANSENKE